MLRIKGHTLNGAGTKAILHFNSVPAGSSTFQFSQFSPAGTASGTSLMVPAGTASGYLFLLAQPQGHP